MRRVAAETGGRMVENYFQIDEGSRNQLATGSETRTRPFVEGTISSLP